MFVMSNTVDKALELGTKYFKVEDYKRAKDVFIKVIRLIKTYSEKDILKLRSSMNLTQYTYTDGKTEDKSKKVLIHPQYIRVLDNLSACWEKLNELEKALKITDKMIKLEAYNLKCYIRRGKLFQRLDRHKDAYMCYKIALRHARYGHESLKIEYSQKFIDFTTSQKNLTKERLNKASNSQATKVEKPDTFKRVFIDPIEENAQKTKRPKQDLHENLIDFISILPLEVLPIILNNFSTRELLRLITVSKSWYKKILFFPQLFHSFDLSKITNRQLKQFTLFLQKEFSSNIREEDSQLNFKINSFKSISLGSRTPSEQPLILKTFLTQLQKYKCDRLSLTVPFCTTRQLFKYIIPNDTFCESIKELSIVTQFRVDRSCEVGVLSRFQNLHRLDIIFDVAVVPMSSSFDDSNGSVDPISLQSEWSSNLASLRLICDQRRVRSFPLYTVIKNSNLDWTNLEKLYITGVTFEDETANFMWLTNFSSIRELWLENNKNCKLESFLNTLKTNRIFKDLQTLTFREDVISNKFDLEEPNNRYMYPDNLKNVISIDVMGSSISGRGLTRLITYLNGPRISRINIGDCPNVRFGRYSVDTDTSILSLTDFFIDLDNLLELSLPQSGSLDDNAMTLLIEQLPKIPNLQKLDLSMNTLITGVSLYQFIITIFNLNNHAPLRHLVIDGCGSVSHITVNMLKTKRLVNKIDCVYEREAWNRFGINSFKYSK